MPNDRPVPPTLDELIAILDAMDSLEANASFNPANQNRIGITMWFTRVKLGNLDRHIFEWPSQVLNTIKSELYRLRLQASILEADEELERSKDPKKTIDDAMAFIGQELNQDMRSLGSLYTQMRQDHFRASLKYLQELKNRRREIDELLVKRRKRKVEDDLRRATEETIRRKEEEKAKEDRRRAEAEAEKRKAHERWEREDEAKRREKAKQTSDSGFAPGSEQGRAWEAFRAAGGFEHFRGTFFEDAINTAFEEALYRGSKSERFKEAFGGRSEFRSEPPPRDRYSNSRPQQKLRWFEVLGVPANSDKSTIKSAWRKLCKLHQPRTSAECDDKSRAKKMMDINIAKDEGLAGL
jgi:hypothetical protein